MFRRTVSTRKVASTTEKLCGRSLSSRLVSKLAKDLDAHVESWRTRPLSGLLIVTSDDQEIKRRTSVVSIFPNRQSALRLIGAVCMEQSNELETSRYLEKANILIVNTITPFDQEYPTY